MKETVLRLLRKWILSAVCLREPNAWDVLGDIDSTLKEFAFNLTIYADFTIQTHTNVSSVTQDSWLEKIRNVESSLSLDVSLGSKENVSLAIQATTSYKENVGKLILCARDSNSQLWNVRNAIPAIMLLRASVRWSRRIRFYGTVGR